MLAIGATGVAGAATAQWFNIMAENSDGTFRPDQAHRALQDGQITLIDIRRPDEWHRTGVAEGAHPIDMRRSDFIDELLIRVNGDLTKPVAVICARGVRSSRMAAHLEQAGFTQIIDIPEGMLGSGAGPGWLGRELPVVLPE